MASRLWNLVSRSAAQPAEWTDHVETGGSVASDDDVRHVLARLCDANADALALSFDDEAVCKVRFVELGDEVFRVVVEGDLPPRLRPPSQCSISCRFGQRNRVFIATLLAVRPGEMSGGALELLLRIPGEIAAGDPRMAFRVPILKPADLEIELLVDGEPIENAIALNLSLIGMLIEVWQDTEIPPHTKLEVLLRRGRDRVRLRAELRRRYERRLAVFFPEVLRDASLDPPPELQSMVRDLEALWLRQRAR
jgi:hypothetical protein